MPEISHRRDFSANLKNKAQSTSYESKQMRYDNPKLFRLYSLRRSDFSSPRYSYRNGVHIRRQLINRTSLLEG